MEIQNKASTDRIIAAAIRVHKELDPGFLVRSYLKAANLTDALLLNFATARLTVKRVGREYHPTSKGEDVVL